MINQKHNKGEYKKAGFRFVEGEHQPWKLEALSQSSSDHGNTKYNIQAVQLGVITTTIWKKLKKIGYMTKAGDLIIEE